MIGSDQEMAYPMQREGWGPGCMQDRNYDNMGKINNSSDKEGERAANDKDPESPASDIEIYSAVKNRILKMECSPVEFRCERNLASTYKKLCPSPRHLFRFLEDDK
jgi:hypothetical protein